MPVQFVEIVFKPGGRPYVYHNSGEPVAVGDTVTVTTQRGRLDVAVVAVTDRPPSYQTKPILGKAAS